MKKFMLPLIAIIVVLFAIGCDENDPSGPSGSYMDVSPQEASDLIDENPDLIIIDVSTAWADGHIPGAVNYPWGDGSFEAAVPNWDEEDMYLIYCHGDAPAIAAAQHLVDNDFDNVYRLEGNYGAWVDAGYDIVVETYMDVSAADLYQMMMDDPDLIDL